MSLGRRAMTVGAWTLASRLLGLLRDRLWAGALGGSPLLDAFLVAFALPNMLRELFGDGALSAAFLPRYVQARDRDPAAADRFAGAVIARLALLLSGLALLGMAAAAVVAGLGAGKASLVALLAIPMLPYLVFICLVALMAGVLNGRRRFWVPAAMPVVLNLALISTVLLGPEREAALLPYAVLVAGLAQAGLMLWALRRSGGIPPAALRPAPEEGELRQAFLPVLASASVHQVNALVGQLIALVCIAGSGPVAFLYFANRLLQFPLALVAHAVTTAAYPAISSHAAQGWAGMGDGLRHAARLLAFWLLPAAVGLLITAEPLVRTIYQTGAFDAEGVARTVLVTRMLALALVPIALQKLLVRAFHARRDQRTPMRVSLGMVGLNLVLNLILVWPLQEAGLALATALSSLAGCLALAWLLHRRGSGALLPWRELLRPLAAALLMGLAVGLLLHCWPQPAGRASGYAALRLLAAVALGAGAYLAVAGTAWLRRPGPAEPPLDGPA